MLSVLQETDLINLVNRAVYVGSANELLLKGGPNTPEWNTRTKVIAYARPLTWMLIGPCPDHELIDNPVQFVSDIVIRDLEDERRHLADSPAVAVSPVCCGEYDQETRLSISALDTGIQWIFPNIGPYYNPMNPVILAERLIQEGIFKIVDLNTARRSATR